MFCGRFCMDLPQWWDLLCAWCCYCVFYHLAGMDERSIPSFTKWHFFHAEALYNDSFSIILRWIIYRWSKVPVNLPTWIWVILWQKCWASLMVELETIWWFMTLDYFTPPQMCLRMRNMTLFQVAHPFNFISQCLKNSFEISIY